MNKDRNAKKNSPDSTPKPEVNPVLREGPNIRRMFIDEILSLVGPTTVLLDLCCGPGYFLKSLSRKIPRAFLTGIDISPDMLKEAKQNTSFLSHVAIVKGDILRLPFSDSSFDVVTCQLGPASMTETCRVIKSDGWFIYTGVGPRSNRELEAVFKERYTFNPHKDVDDTTWKDTLLKSAQKAGFSRTDVSDFLNFAYYTPKGLTGYLEAIPIVKGFDSREDHIYIEEMKEKYSTPEGIKITHQYFMVKAQK